MRIVVINRCLSLDQDRITGFLPEHISGLRTILNVYGVKDERAGVHFYDIIFLDPVTTRPILQFQLMSPHRRSRRLPFRLWWAAFRLYVGQMFGNTGEQRKNWRLDNPRAFGDQVDRSTPRTTSLGKNKRTGEGFCRL
jgi:hypothetical protein